MKIMKIPNYLINCSPLQAETPAHTDTHTHVHLNTFKHLQGNAKTRAKFIQCSDDD